MKSPFGSTACSNVSMSCVAFLMTASVISLVTTAPVDAIPDAEMETSLGGIGRNSDSLRLVELPRQDPLEPSLYADSHRQGRLPSQAAERQAKKVSMQGQQSDENDDPWSSSSSSFSSSSSVGLEVSVNDDGVVRATADISSVDGENSNATDTAVPSEIAHIEKNADTSGTGDPIAMEEIFETPISSTTNQAPSDARDLYRNQFATMRHLHDHLSTMNNTSITSGGISNEKEEPESSIGIEFSIQNTNNGNKPIIISGLGLYTTAGSIDKPIPCRVKVYTSSIVTMEAMEREFQLALDAEDVLCRGPDAETLVTSDFFLRQYLNSQKGQQGQQDGDGGLDIPGRQLSKGESINFDDLKDKGSEESHGRRIQNDSNENESSHPLVIPSQSILSMYIVVLTMDANGDLIKIFAKPGSTHLTEYTSNENLSLHEGVSIKKAYLVDAAANGGSEEDVPEIVKPTVFMGTLYYDILSKADSSALEDYYNYLEEKVHDAIQGGCYGSLVTGYQDSVGSYGLMFDVTSMVDGPESSSTIVIYGMDVYIRNQDGMTPIEVYVRINNDDDSNGEDIANRYTSYVEPDGQTLEENWELVAEGSIQGRGAGTGTPIPPELWLKTIVIEPGKSVGFYVTALEAPHLRYRSSSLPEGNVYSTDGLLGVTVGRSWGEYPLKGDGSDVYFSQREFSGTFHYHAYDGVCKTDVPSSAPTVRDASIPVATPAATVAATAAPTPDRTTPVTSLCDLEQELTTTFQDGTGSYGILFDIVAKRDLTVTGIDMFIDWNSGENAEVLAYARKGSWFGFQNDPNEWPFLITNTTIHRPINFHNRTSNGPHIPYEKKKTSAIIPDSEFIPLSLLEGETWSIYVCTNVADLRYTLGTSIGNLFTENDDMQILEGAGAADWPPFGGASAGIVGAKEYTFYAPRVFNGNVRYEYKAECPSAAPSGAGGVTVPPTAFPLLTTPAKYQFFVEYATDRSVNEISQDMEFAVNAVIDNFLKDATNPLYQYARNDGLAISSLIASVTSPTEIGYLCIPDPPNVCNLISVDVEATHRSTASTEDVKYALLYQAAILPSLINVAMYEVKYVGERAIASDSEILLTGVPDRLMGDVESKYFEEATLKFLNQQVSKSKYGAGEGALQILSVSVNGQKITSDSSILESGRSTRRLKKANNVKVRVKGQHRPPPELDLGEFVESSINADREAFDRVLGEREAPTPSEAGTVEDSSDLGYFDEVQVAGARDIKETDTDDPLPPKSYTPVIIQKETDDSIKGVLNIAAIIVGALISILSAAFFLRPHRRSVIFGTKTDERLMYTQQVDEGDASFMQSDSDHRGSFRGSFKGSFRKNRDRKTPLKSSMRSSTTGRTHGMNSSMISSAGFSVVSVQDTDIRGSQRQMGQSTLPIALSNRHLRVEQGDLRRSTQSQGVPRNFRNSIQSQQSYNHAVPSSFRNSTLSQNSYQQSAQSGLRNSAQSHDSYNSAGQFSRSSNTSGQSNLRSSMQSQHSHRSGAQLSRSINPSTAFQ